MFMVIDLCATEATEEHGMVSTVRKSRAGMQCPGAATESEMPGLYALAAESQAASFLVREPLPGLACSELRRLLERQWGQTDSLVEE